MRQVYGYNPKLVELFKIKSVTLPSAGQLNVDLKVARRIPTLCGSFHIVRGVEQYSDYLEFTYGTSKTVKYTQLRVTLLTMSNSHQKH